LARGDERFIELAPFGKYSGEARQRPSEQAIGPEWRIAQDCRLLTKRCFGAIQIAKHPGDVPEITQHGERPGLESGRAIERKRLLVMRARSDRISSLGFQEREVEEIEAECSGPYALEERTRLGQSRLRLVELAHECQHATQPDEREA